MTIQNTYNEVESRLKFEISSFLIACVKHYLQLKAIQNSVHCFVDYIESFLYVINQGMGWRDRNCKKN